MHLSVIAKAPVAGIVKTRLCPPCSHDQAARIARAALADTLKAADRVAEDASARKVLLLDGAPQPWMPTTFDVVAQRGEGLAQRLCNGFRDLGPGVIVGMETPRMVGELAAALQWARRGVDTIGLATDGGYWMIGLSAESMSSLGGLFEDIPMSSSHTGTAQVRRMHRLGRRVHMLSMARDLDTIDDLRAVAHAAGDGELAHVAREVVADLDGAALH